MLAASVLVMAGLLAGCGDKKDKPATQTAARVNREEITVHQINFLLQQQRAIPPAQAASAGKAVLERLIDQELALQQAADKKIDRDPRVAQQIEAARREIIARAYVEKVGSGAPRPTPQEIKKYYDEHPALFSQRRIYTLQEILVEAPPAQLDQVRSKLEAAKDLGEFVNYLRTNEIKFTGNQGVRPAEQLPMGLLPVISRMKDGQTVFGKTPEGARIVILARSVSQPVDEARARPAIEQYLLNERKRKVVEDDIKALRTSAKIEYLGEYAKSDAERAAERDQALKVKPSVSPLTGTPASSPEPILPVRAASAPASGVLDKGLKGLK
jgi:EpsD family peptidyl-prolyl cis-trans isomerase